LIVNVDRFPEFIQEVGSEAVDIGFAVWSQAGGLFLYPFIFEAALSHLSIIVLRDFAGIGSAPQFRYSKNGGYL